MRTRECPECRWESVVDGSGRRRIQMRWAMPAAPVAQPSAEPVPARLTAPVTRAA
jgi:hypothetical protein